MVSIQIPTTNTDGDGIPDGEDEDSDGNGIPDELEPGVPGQPAPFDPTDDADPSDGGGAGDDGENDSGEDQIDDDTSDDAETPQATPGDPDSSSGILQAIGDLPASAIAAAPCYRSSRCWRRCFTSRPRVVALVIPRRYRYMALRLTIRSKRGALCHMRCASCETRRNLGRQGHSLANWNQRTHPCAS